MPHDHLFGVWLRQQRQTRDLTQAELAHQVGCATVTVKKIESGEHRPSKQVANRLADVLGIEPAKRASFVAFARGMSIMPPATSPVIAVAKAESISHLPLPLTPFVGRNQELAHLQRLLDTPNARLLTIVGPGGIGKTRLALEVAHRTSATFAHGAHFVPLAVVATAEELLFAIGDVLEYPLDGHETPVVQLIRALHDKTLLLILDNIEHLLDHVSMLSDLLASVPHLKLLITSRERLNLPGEWVVPLEGLDYPLTAEENHLEHASAIRLFCQSAQRVQPDFSLRETAQEVLRICQLVEGLPLALELAAAWVRVLPCTQIVEQISANSDFLAAPQRAVPERHRSLRIVFDQSWMLLSATEQAALAKLSVFHGTFDHAAAAAVGEASLAVLASLADKSLLRSDGMGRYGLHGLLRRYAADHLAEQEAADAHRERAISYLTGAAARAQEAGAQRQAASLLGQTIAIAEETTRSDILGELHHQRGLALMRVGLWTEAHLDLVAALAAIRPEQVDEQVQIRLALSNLDFMLHDLLGMRRHAVEALALAEGAQRTDLMAAALVALGNVETNDGHLMASVSLYERVLAQGGDAHNALGLTYYWLGRYPEAVAHQRIAIEKMHHKPLEQIFPLQDLGLALAAIGQYQEAVWAFLESQRLCREYENWPFLSRSVATLAGFHLDVFDYVGNEALAEEARSLARSADFVLAEASAGLDLLLNFARRNEVERAERLLAEVTEAVEKTRGSHGWLWRLRLAQARAELAYAREEWEEARQLAEIALQESIARGRIKYQAHALKVHALALAALGRQPEALVDLNTALAIARPTTDPALFVQMAAACLAVEADDTLATEAHQTAQRLSAALPTDEMRHRFEAAEPVRLIARSLR